MLGRALLLLGLGSLAAAQGDPADVLIRLRDRVLAQVETQWASTPVQARFALRWETVEVDGTPTRIRLNPKLRAQDQLEVTQDIAGGLKRKGVEIELPLPGEERYGVYNFRGELGVLPTGFQSEWVTAKP